MVMKPSLLKSIRVICSGAVSLLAASCGGGYGGGSGMSAGPSSVNVSVSPATITVGQSATVSWSSNSGGCTASGGWSGTQTASGTQVFTPTAAGTMSFMLECAGNGYSTNSASTVLTVNAASAYSQTVLLADQTGGIASHTDANLVNPWGVVIQGTAPAWVANNHTATSTLYDGAGNPRPAAPLIVTLPANGTTTFDATGIVSNGTSTDFVVTSAGKSAGASFIFDGEGGMIAGWAPAVDATHAIAMYIDTGGAVYKGLAIAKNGGQSFLYAADFHNRKVDVFSNTFAKQAVTATSFSFADAAIPATFAPFNIQAIDLGAGTQIVVTYAQQAAPDKHDEVDGPGLGYVDVFDTNGTLVKQLISAGKLNAPWGLARAPANFGTLSNALLVGNFGDGRINGYDAASGTFIGTVTNSTGAPLVASGLWGIAFGNDANNQPHNTLFYAAGTGGEAHGNYGRVDLSATPPVLGAAPTVTLTIPAGVLKGTVALTAVPTSTLAIAKVDFYTGTTLIGSAATSPYTVNWDTTKVANGSVGVRAVATDVNGNVGSSAIATVNVTQ
jgi:uncharacterized protein (TIGR03118 family)